MVGFGSGFFYSFVCSSSVTCVKTERMMFPSSLKGAGGGLHQDFLELDFLVVSDREELDSYQICSWDHLEF